MAKNDLSGAEKHDIYSNKYKGANVKQSRLNGGPIGKTSRKGKMKGGKVSVK